MLHVFIVDVTNFRLSFVEGWQSLCFKCSIKIDVLVFTYLWQISVDAGLLLVDVLTCMRDTDFSFVTNGN